MWVSVCLRCVGGGGVGPDRAGGETGCVQLVVEWRQCGVVSGGASSPSLAHHS